MTTSTFYLVKGSDSFDEVKRIDIAQTLTRKLGGHYTYLNPSDKYCILGISVCVMRDGTIDYAVYPNIDIAEEDVILDLNL